MSRRTFTADYKLQIIGEAARCTRRGELRSLLEREGLSTAHLTKWRALATEAARVAFNKSTSDSTPPDPPDAEVALLRRLVALQGRVLRRLLTATHGAVYGVEADLAELRRLAEPLGFGELVAPQPAIGAQS